MRLGRRDRLDRRRRGVLQPRRADRPDHDAAHPAAVGRGRSRTSRSRRSTGSSRPSSAAWTTPREPRPAPSRRATVARRSAPAGWARRWPSASRAPGVDGRRLQPDAGAARPRSPPSSAPARPRRRPRPRAAAGRRASRCSPTTPRSRALYGGPDGAASPALRPGVVARRHEHGPAGHDPVARRRAVRAVGAGILDAPVSGSVASRRSRRADDHGRRRGGRPRARPAGPRAAGRDRSSTSAPLGTGAAMKLAVNTVIFGLNGARRRGARPRRAQRASTRRSPTTSSPRAPSGAPFVGYKRAAFLEPEATPVAFSLDLAEKDLRLIAGLAERARRRRCPRPPSNLEPIRAAAAVGRRRRRLLDGRESPARGGPAMTDRP